MNLLGWLCNGAAITAQLTTLLAKVTAMSSQLDSLTANVTALVAAAEAQSTLLTTVKADLDAAIAAGNDGAQLQALSDKLAAEVTAVNAAIAANTPAPAPAPSDPAAPSAS